MPKYKAKDLVIIENRFGRKVEVSKAVAEKMVKAQEAEIVGKFKPKG